MLSRRLCSRSGLLVLALGVGLAGCSSSKPAPPAPPPPRVSVIHPVMTPVRDYWVYNGYLEPIKSVEVRSKIRGFLAKVEFVEGAEVALGEPLYKIDRLEYDTAAKKADAELKKSEAQIKLWEAQIVQAKADLERVNKAVSSGAESRFELDKAQAALDVRIAELEAARATRDAAASTLKTAEIQVGYTDIRAKIGGRISRTLVDEGNLVIADTTLLTTIVSVDELFVMFDAPEIDFLVGQQALLRSTHPSPEGQIVPIEIGVSNEEGYLHPGFIDFRENRVETSTGTIRIRGRVKNPLVDNKVRMLYPGLYARVRVPKSDPVPQPVLPEDCLLSGQEGQFVYVVNAEGVVAKRLVTIGATVWKALPAVPGVTPPSWVAVNPQPAPPQPGKPPAPTRRNVKAAVAIAAGLQPGDRVLLDGLQQVRPGSTVVPEEWVFTPPVESKK